MRYIGNFQNHNLPNLDLCKLFAYVDEREIIISYNNSSPFLIEQISILIDSIYSTYAVFECKIHCNTDIEAKEFGKCFTNALIEFIRQYK